MASHSHGSRHAACLERSCRIQPFILDENMRKLAAGKQRRESLAKRDLCCIRKNLGITPHASHAPRQIFAPQLPFQSGKIVADKKHSTIFRADIQRTISRKMLSTSRAFKVGNSHRGKDSILAVGFWL